ncbi:hypothetical protein D3C72_1888290 [compost metagenome]
MGEAEVQHIVRLAVEAASPHEVLDLAVQPRVVEEDAGRLHADEVQRRRQVELHAPDLAVADVFDGVDEGFDRNRILIVGAAGAARVDLFH